MKYIQVFAEGANNLIVVEPVLPPMHVSDSELRYQSLVGLKGRNGRDEGRVGVSASLGLLEIDLVDLVRRSLDDAGLKVLKT